MSTTPLSSTRDRNFCITFRIRSILTSVEFDHADIYRDLDAVKFAFKRLVNLVPRRGRIIAWDGSPNVSECVERAFCPVERYGFHPDSFWRIENVQYESREHALDGASRRASILRTSNLPWPVSTTC